MSRSPALRAVGCALAITWMSGPASAHLIEADRGTANVVGDSVFAVLSVPVSALHGVDDDGDGLVDADELTRHEEAAKAEIDRRLELRDGAAVAATVRVDLILSPPHDAPAGRATQIVALKHARFGAPPRDLRVRCDLFGDRASERTLSITASRHVDPTRGKESELAELTPARTEHAFFRMEAADATPSEERRSPAKGAWPLGLLFAGAVAASWIGRARATGAAQR